MEDCIVNEKDIKEYAEYLRNEERAEGTIEKYVRDVRAFAEFASKHKNYEKRYTAEAGERVLSEAPAIKETVVAWKAHLIEAGYAPVTINSMLAALHGFFDFLGIADCKVKHLKVQKKIFRDPSRELTKGEYEKLLGAAVKKGKPQIALLLETICATGIRVSEVQYITVEAAHKGRVDISLKGKIRTILIPKALSHKLIKYAQKQKISTGEIFLAKSGKGISRKQIWTEMKKLCKFAGVASSKVFPHNLRHLFATAYYRVYKDIARLADLLGHSSIETTRIYITTSGTDHAKQLDRLHLVT